MNKLYRFSPIQDEKALFSVYEYIAYKLEELSEKIFNTTLPITSLKIFSHYPKEYDYIRSIISKKGFEASFNSQTSYYVGVDKKIRNYNIKHLGVRVVDPYRLHVGCGDYECKDFHEFKERNIGKSEFVRLFNDKGDTLEVWHPDYDILGYVIPSQNFVLKPSQ